MQIADTILMRQIEQITEFVTTSRHKLFVKDVFSWNQDSEVTIYGRSSHTSLVINDKLYIIGGMDSKCPNQFNCSDDLLIYDLSNIFAMLIFIEKQRWLNPKRVVASHK
jgi:hypothetical protein